MMKDGTFNKEALGEKLASYANKLASNRFIAAIRDAFASTIPITITAAFFLLINNVLLTEETGLLRGIPGRAMISEICVQAYNGTLGILGLMVTFLIGLRLARSYDADGALEGIVALAAYNVTGTNGKGLEIAGALTQTYTSASAMLLGIIAALVSVPLVVKLTNNDRLKIKMPDSVPPAIAKSFNSLIPTVLTISLFAIVEVGLRTATGLTIPEIIINILQAPLVGAGKILMIISGIVRPVAVHGILMYVFFINVCFYLWDSRSIRFWRNFWSNSINIIAAKCGSD